MCLTPRPLSWRPHSVGYSGSFNVTVDVTIPPPMTPSPANKGDGADTIPPPPAPADEIPVPSAISTAAEKTASLHFGELYDAVASLSFSADHPDLPENEVRALIYPYVGLYLSLSSPYLCDSQVRHLWVAISSPPHHYLSCVCVCRCGTCAGCATRASSARTSSRALWTR